LADLFIVGVAPIDYSPILLLRLFGFRIAPDTLSSTGLRRWPARHYPCLWIQRPSSERWRDFNPPHSCATQHTLRPCPTPAVTAACCNVEAATLVINGSPPITRTTFPTCRAHYPGGLSGCTCRLLPRLCSLPQLAGGSASALSLSRCYGADRGEALPSSLKAIRRWSIPCHNSTT
jgi:hypothetical protein